MTEQELTQLIQKSLYDVAPDIEGEAIAPDKTFRDQFEIDSMDFLNLIVALHKATGIDIPEADYPKLDTLNKAVRYLAEKGA